MKGIRSTSGIIASFNHELYIEEAVLSLIGQVDELVVVDDQSQDSTLQKLCNLQSSHENLKVIKPSKKLGVSEAFNLAAKQATSEVLIIQGADDVSLSNRVSDQISLLEKRDTVMAYSLPDIIDRHSNILPNHMAPEFFRGRIFHDDLSELFYNGNFICAPSVAMYKSDFINFGGFLKNVDAWQDYALWLKCSENGKFQICNRPVVRYRKHANNLSRRIYNESVAHIREQSEFWFVINNFLSEAKPETLNHLLGVVGIHANNEKDDFKKILVKINHGNMELKHMAIQDLLSYSQNEYPQDTSARRYSDLIELILVEGVAKKLNERS
jgi:glycosyltransferase involved in cell wall biosynthesis